MDPLAREVLQEFGGEGEDDGGVLLGRDAVESLQIAQLQRRRWLVDYVGRVFQRSRRPVLALRRDHLRANKCPTSFDKSPHRRRTPTSARI